MAKGLNGRTDSEGSSSSDWIDPGFLERKKPIRNLVRLFFQLFKPPRGHRTVPTRPGAVLILLALGIGTAAFNTSQNILYIALALLLSSLLLSGVLSWLNFKGCRWRMDAVGPFRVGEATSVVIEAFNANRWLPIYSIAFELCAKDGEARQRLVIRRGLAAGQTCRLDWRWIPAQRGEEVLILQRLVSKFPFGFLQKSIEYTVEHKVLVWPEKLNVHLSPNRAPAARPLGRVAQRPGWGAELRRLRDYQYGDSFRQIHWKATARQQRLIVREDFEETQQAYAVSLGGARDQWHESAQFERFCAFAATVIEEMYVEGRLAGVAFPGERIVNIHNLAELHRVFDRIALLTPQSIRPIAEGSRRLSVLSFVPEGRSSVVCLSDGNPLGQS